MINIYLTVETAAAAEAFIDDYFTSKDAQKLTERLRSWTQKAFADKGLKELSYSVPHRVSRELKPPLVLDADGSPIPVAEYEGAPKQPEDIVVPLQFDDAAAEPVIDEETLATLLSAIEGARQVGADLAFQGAHYAPAPAWCRGAGLGRGFGTRDDALEAIKGPFLHSRRLDGSGVNVVVVDQGLDRHALGGNFAGGWSVGDRRPGELQHVHGVTQNDHGMLIARNLLAVAPKARLFDLPLIPDRILHPEAFLSVAEAHFRWVREWIVFLRQSGLVSGAWVVVNAWAIFDRSTETPPGNYSENSSHSFNQALNAFAKDNIDVIFAAGNCGQFCPDQRCGAYDIGPGTSIYGAHALAGVLTVGALRADGQWPGASSQGPGPEDNAQPSRLSREKPDLCAPSYFVEPHNAHVSNGGTSTAAALAAGVAAALRGARGFDQIPTLQFFDALKRSTSGGGAPWDSRLGFGMLDARGAFEALSE